MADERCRFACSCSCTSSSGGPPRSGEVQKTCRIQDTTHDHDVEGRAERGREEGWGGGVDEGGRWVDRECRRFRARPTYENGDPVRTGVCLERGFCRSPSCAVGGFEEERAGGRWEEEWDRPTAWDVREEREMTIFCLAPEGGTEVHDDGSASAEENEEAHGTRKGGFPAASGIVCSSFFFFSSIAVGERRGRAGFLCSGEGMVRAAERPGGPTPFRCNGSDGRLSFSSSWMSLGSSGWSLACRPGRRVFAKAVPLATSPPRWSRKSPSWAGVSCGGRGTLISSLSSAAVRVGHVKREETGTPGGWRSARGEGKGCGTRPRWCREAYLRMD